MSEELTEGMHVIPTNDLKEHEVSAECWCRPQPDFDEVLPIYVHNSLDGREKKAH